MNKPELVSALSEKTGMTKKDAAAAVDALIETIQNTLASGEDVRLTGLGCFEVKERPEHACRDPKTGGIMTIPAARTVHFKSGSTLKGLVK